MQVSSIHLQCGASTSVNFGSINTSTCVTSVSGRTPGEEETKMRTSNDHQPRSRAAAAAAIAAESHKSRALHLAPVCLLSDSPNESNLNQALLHLGFSFPFCISSDAIMDCCHPHKVESSPAGDSRLEKKLRKKFAIFCSGRTVSKGPIKNPLSKKSLVLDYDSLQTH